MSEFSVPIKRITIEPHPDPEVHSLEVGKIDGYNLIVRKGDYETNDLVVYIPEAAVVPDELLDRIGLKGNLSGPGKNVVKALKIRKIVSQGLAYRPEVWPDHWVEGLDVGDELGITKYEQPIPTALRGNVERGPTGLGVETLTYTDIDNIKKNPGKLEPGELVVMTEKEHGTCSITVRTKEGNTYVSSKGQAGKWLVIKKDPNNVYWRAVIKYELEDKLDEILAATNEDTAILYGEIFGPGVQDLTYGVKPGDIAYAAFDLKLKSTGYVNWTIFESLTEVTGIPHVPVLYIGPYSQEILEKYTSGKSIWPGADNLREGLVAKPLQERDDYRGNRVIYKSISNEYLFRRGETTEYQ